MCAKRSTISTNGGFDALDPQWSGGRPSKVDRAKRVRIACIARCCPRKLGRPFSTWSLRENLIDSDTESFGPTDSNTLPG